MSLGAKSSLVISLAILLSACAATAQSTGRKVLSGHVPAGTRDLAPQGRLPGSTLLRLSISLPLRDRAALTDLIDALYNPANPQYRHYLTPDQFDARFGPTEQDYEAAVSFAVRNGFTVTQRHPNRMLLQVSARVSDIERAFQVSLRTYQHPTEPRLFYAPDVEPSVDAGMPVLSIAGLDNFSRPRPQMRSHAPAAHPARPIPQGGSGPNGNLAGFDYRAVYAPGVSLTGTGQSIGLVEFDGYYPGDITSYELQTGIPNVTLQKVLLGGFNGIPTTGPNTGNSEVALDIEMAISMAPGLSNVVVYEADPNTGQLNDVLQAMSTNTVTKQFSCSWLFSGLTTADRTTMDGYFLKFAAQGQSFFAASGDSGATSGAIDAPSDDPYVTLVGGTTLATAGPGGAWLSETVWNSQEGPGMNSSGGGVSAGTASYPIPNWQKGVNMTASNGSSTKRNCPDVAMVADNIFIVADNGQSETTGGTSAGAPLWAGFVALANQQAAAAALPPIGFINPALYNLGTNAGYTAFFDDITSGNNTNTSASQYLAVTGYDLCTGWGSPSGGSLLIALTQPDGFQITPGRGVVANGPVGGPFTETGQMFSLANAGTSPLNWSLGSTSTWLSVSTQGGTLTPGGPPASVTLTITPTATTLPAGVYSANVWFTNLTSGLTQLRQVTVQVAQDLVQDGGFEAGDFTYWILQGDPLVYSNNFVDDGSSTGYSPEAGVWFGALGQVSTLAYLFQPLATYAGQPYLLTLWLGNPSGAVPNQFQVLWGPTLNSAALISNQVNMGAFNPRQMQFLVTATTNLMTLAFGFRNDNDYLTLDSVSMLPVPSPMIQASTVGGQVHLAWSTLAGLQYQVQYETDISSAGWVNLGAAVTATGTSITATDNLGPDPERFYRVLLLP